MVDMGAEVGQKMRSAIKAKLTELNCYVDDELPDYIMVMVANKRTKTQMNEDLNLFLNNKTSTFVDWLHIVLKKLKEVTVTNLEVYKKATKRKSNEFSDVKVKNEKKVKKEKQSKTTGEPAVKQEKKSLTDDLPLNVRSLTDNRKIMVIPNNSNESINKPEQTFDIPSISEVDQSNLTELEEIEKQIKNVKSRLGLKLDDEIEEDKLKRIVEINRMQLDVPKPSQPDNVLSNGRHIEVEPPRLGNRADSSDSRGIVENKKREHSRITFSKDSNSPATPPRKSILERLGKFCDKRDERDDRTDRKRRDDEIHSKKKGVRSDRENDRSDKKESLRKPHTDVRKILDRDGVKKDVKKRLGISSKVTVPKLDPQLLEDTFKKREVVSVVKVKPRTLPPNVQQANKNLLLKAMADAQKSIAQAKIVGNIKKTDTDSEELVENSTIKYRNVNQGATRKISSIEKDKLKRLITNKRQSLNEEETSELEYIPKPVKQTQSNIAYVPSSLNDKQMEKPKSPERKQKFIVTLDGVQKSDIVNKASVRQRLQGRKTPSPIIFENHSNDTPTKLSTKIDKSKIPEELPVVPVSLKKIKEKCKYFPLCRNGAKCDFYHPTKNCEQFPVCKFGEKCLYIHPSCKFGASCTKRDCQYSHAGSRSITSGIKLPPQPQICKFYPQCTNLNCSFYHPKPCKFGKYCKNQSICTFNHSVLPSKSSLTWRSK